jgi:hypothetical protein
MKKEPQESPLNSKIIRVPFKEVNKFMKSGIRPAGTDQHIFVFGRKLLRADYPNGILTEVSKTAKEYIIRPA